MILSQSVATYIFEYYHLELTIQSLIGWSDLNYKGISSDGSQIYLIKISDLETTLTHLQFQNRLLIYIAGQSLGIAVPKVIINNDGEGISQLINGRLLRVLTWVPGEMIAKVNPQDDHFLSDLGRTAGIFSKSLANYKDLGGHYVHPWDPSNTDWIYDKIHLINDASISSCIIYFLDMVESNKNILNELRKSINHNDLNDYNIVTDLAPREKRITGYIDFGDAVYTHTINELAIMLAYIGMGKIDPLEAMCTVVHAYHGEFPLTEIELNALYLQIGRRLSLSVVHAAINRANQVDNEYVYVSVEPTLTLLKTWRQIAPNWAEYNFRNACGLITCKNQKGYDDFIKQNNPAPIVPYKALDYIPLDLSISSHKLGTHDNYSSPEKMSRLMANFFSSEKGEIGIGGYGEIRPFYLSKNFEVESNTGIQYRSKHLGIDLWAPVGTKIFSPYKAVVHSLVNNDGHQDYGPTLILKHEIDHHHPFFTLYGHLSLSTLSLYSEGDDIEAGDHIGYLGHKDENGGWAPHLHFQVILDMLDYSHDFPGVVTATSWRIWSSICPDPAPFFDLVKDNPSRSSDLKSKRKIHLGPNLSLSYREPLEIVRGHGQYLISSEGRRYLDLVNNVAHVGHEHPEVVKAGQQQMAVLNTNTRYLHPKIIDYAEDLLATFPDPLDVIYFVNSGSEANELALRMVRTISGKENMIAIEGGYHGNSAACIDVSSYKFNGPGGQGQPKTTSLLHTPDTFNGVYGSDEEYVDHAIGFIHELSSDDKHVAGFIGESIMSCAGQILLPPGYLRAVYDSIRDQGGLCIADEVQVGFGRCGSHFWVFQSQGVIPDIVTLGKPMGNGHPIGAVVTSRKIAEAFNNGMEYFNTYGGNPVSCAIGRSVLKTINQENLQNNAQRVGSYLLKKLCALEDEFPLIGDVRGMGLFIGIELVTENDHRSPAPDQAAYLVNRMYVRGYLLSTDGPNHNVIKIKPPMCITKENVDHLIKNMKLVLQENYLTYPVSH